MNILPNPSVPNETDESICYPKLIANLFDLAAIGKKALDDLHFIWREFCGPAISHVFRSGSPSAILRGVVAVVVNSVNLKIIGVPVVQRPIPKSLKGLPLIANANSTTTVKRIFLLFWISASLPHLHPNKVQPSFRKAMPTPSGTWLAFRSGALLWPLQNDGLSAIRANVGILFGSHVPSFKGAWSGVRCSYTVTPNFIT